MFDSELDRFFKRMSRSFFDNEGLERDFAKGTPYYYGYTMTIGPDGQPIVKEYGNVRPGTPLESDTREPLVETISDDKSKIIKLVAEMPGVEKSDVKITVENQIVQIIAERDGKKYQTKVPLTKEVDERSAKATYKNGILEVTFNVSEERPTGRVVEVE